MSRRDHPRSRGVYRGVTAEEQRRYGSSPLARGLPRRHRRRTEALRIIPARAGFTGAGRSPRGRRRDHPRSRGVYAPTSPAQCASHGSSPLARGLRGRACTRRRPHRIIPARAGFTRSPPRCAAGRPDHPRSRGVYADGQTPSPEKVGSSPLARGLPSWHVGLRACRGDHPRSRGVYAHGSVSEVVDAGSSPLARGLPRRLQMACIVSPDHPRSRGVYRIGHAGFTVSARIIPARAGFTVSCSPGDGPGWDHPRSRGVYPKNGSQPAISRDHPRSRGVYSVVELHEDLVGRIIPARAGFTSVGKPAVTTSWDHPRSRGVYLVPRAEGQGGGGSSPLARGLPGSFLCRADESRIIPARAGFTWGPGRAGPPVEDHPRSRGVYKNQSELFSRISGIIPARAGFTPMHAPARPYAADHPRSRGVYVVRRCVQRRSVGSSPLARGLPEQVTEVAYDDRIIPARAGFTPPTARPAGTSPDHPRSRGVYDVQVTVPLDGGGSSPLARGLPTTKPTRGLNLGDHPRSRGVYYRDIRGADEEEGSSPLARGLLISS